MRGQLGDQLRQRGMNFSRNHATILNPSDISYTTFALHGLQRTDFWRRAPRLCGDEVPAARRCMAVYTLFTSRQPSRNRQTNGF